jgi:hypothetical protein
MLAHLHRKHAIEHGAPDTVTLEFRPSGAAESYHLTAPPMPIVRASVNRRSTCRHSPVALRSVSYGPVVDMLTTNKHAIAKRSGRKRTPARCRCKTGAGFELESRHGHSNLTTSLLRAEHCGSRGGFCIHSAPGSRVPLMLGVFVPSCWRVSRSHSCVVRRNWLGSVPSSLRAYRTSYARRWHRFGSMQTLWRWGERAVRAGVSGQSMVCVAKRRDSSISLTTSSSSHESRGR